MYTGTANSMIPVAELHLSASSFVTRSLLQSADIIYTLRKRLLYTIHCIRQCSLLLAVVAVSRPCSHACPLFPVFSPAVGGCIG